MKKGSKILLIIAMIMTIFSFMDIINAETLSKKEEINYNNVKFYRKQIGSNNAYCISGFNTPAPLINGEEGGPTNCTAIGETTDNVCYAHIINSTIGSTTGDSVTAANWYTLESNLAAKDCSAASTDIAVYNQTEKITSNLTTLKFNKSGSNYVVTFTLTGKNFSNIGNCTLSGVTGTVNATAISNETSTVTVTVPVANVSRNLNVTVTCPVNQSYKTATIYSCGTYQSLVVGPTTKNKAANVTLSGNIEAEKKGSIRIKKYGRNSQKKKDPLQGVKFKIKNKAGHYINASGEVDEDYIFTTSASGIIQVTNIDIPDPTKSYEFTIEEVSTLSGYVKAIGTKKITLNSSNDFTYDEELINETVRVTISKTDATGKKELPGAKLSILDKNGKVLNKCVFDKEKHLITYSDGKDAEACTWASTDTSYIFEGLPIGKYYLVEDLAPEGYSKSSEKILIEIKDTGAVKDKIVMKNALEVPVPDTLSARSALLLVVAMFDIALGVGIVTYVKNHKIEE